MGVLILWSGGLDSTLLVKRAVDAGVAMRAVFFAYGQAATGKEGQACRQLGNLWGVDWERVAVPLRGLDAMNEGKGPRVIPARNQVLLSLGLNYALHQGKAEVWLGAARGDAKDYVDCGAPFFRAMNFLAHSWGATIQAPLLGLTRKEVRQEARRREVPLDLCWSCYEGGVDPCGLCNSCRQK